MFFLTHELKYVRSAQEKLHSFNPLIHRVVKAMKDEKSGALNEAEYWKDLAQLMEGIVSLYEGEFKRAKNILSNLLSKLADRLPTKKQNSIEGEEAAIILFYLYKLEESMNNQEMSEYYLTKSVQYAERFVP
jgi:hypothetical protein